MVALGSKKQVLVVGNDGVQLYVLKGKTVSLYQDFSNSGGNLTSDLKTAFKATKLPLIVLFDVAEQQYRRETIPKVSFLDKAKVINRKLVMAFPQQLFRASYIAKQKGPASETTAALFAGLSSTLTIMQIMDALLGSEVYIEGAALLPLESISLAVKLATEVHKNNKTTSRSRWSVLMTQDKTGGLRQIVVREGELALTRMTPLIVDVDNPDALGDEMVREFNATLTYLSRFGYVPSDGLELYVVSTPQVGQRLRNYKMPVTDLYTLTLADACTLVGLKPAVNRDSSDYGEILHAGWVASQSSLKVPLSSPVLDKVKQARQSARILIFAFLIGACYLGWQITSLQSTVNTMSNDVRTQEVQKVKLQNDFDDMSKKLSVLKYDSDKTKLLLDAYDDNVKKEMDIKPTLNALMPLMDHNKMTLKNLSIIRDGAVPGSAAVAASMPVADQTKKSVTIEMEITFPPQIKIEEDARATLEFAANLRKRFPGRTITVTEIIGDLALDKTVQGISQKISRDGSGGNDNRSSTSKITFKGVLE